MDETQLLLFGVNSMRSFLKSTRMKVVSDKKSPTLEIPQILRDGKPTIFVDVKDYPNIHIKKKSEFYY